MSFSKTLVHVDPVTTLRIVYVCSVPRNSPMRWWCHASCGDTGNGRGREKRGKGGRVEGGGHQHRVRRAGGRLTVQLVHVRHDGLVQRLPLAAVVEMPRKVEGRALGERCRAWAYGAALAYWAWSEAWRGGGEEVEDVGELEGFGGGLVVRGTGG